MRVLHPERAAAGSAERVAGRGAAGHDPDGDSGLAEPAAFPALLAAPELALYLHLGNVVCMVDASTYLRYADHLLALPRQAEANTAIMNKIDVADAAGRRALRRRPARDIRRASVLLRRRPPRRPRPGVRARRSKPRVGCGWQRYGNSCRGWPAAWSGPREWCTPMPARYWCNSPSRGWRSRLAGAAGGLAHHLRRPGSPGAGPADTVTP